jgi:hypothetical protein
MELVEPSATDTGMYILTLFTYHPLPTGLTHLECGIVEHYVMLMGYHPTLVDALKRFDAKALFV